jgi:tRNA A-37 threonylcarbamoyl transferase component Bud32
VIQLELDGMHWEIQPGWADVLGKILNSEGEPIKTSPVKSVTRHRVGQSIYFIKRYHHEAIPFRSFKFLFKSSQARQEWELAQALAQRDIPTVRHLALGERKSWRGVHESVLLTEGFDGLPLEETPDANPKSIVEFIGRMHEAGVLQQDLHPGNLLVHRASKEIRLVDLHGIIIRDQLSEEERQWNMARLAVSFHLPVEKTVLELSETMGRRFKYERSRRCLRHNREFSPWRSGLWKGWIREPNFTEAAREILNEPDAFLASNGPRILKAGRSSTVGAAHGLVLKRYNFRKAGNLLKDLFRQSKGRRAYRRAYHLELVGVPTARIVATADRRCCGLLMRSCVLMEEIPGAKELGAYLQQTGMVATEVVRRAADLIGALHRAGLRHRDLKESNIVLDETGKLYLLDLDGLEFVDVISESQAAFDLERFARGVMKFSSVGVKQRVAFLRRYCRVRGIKRVPR